ncbi:MoxR family ATPase [Cytophagaceae bacterium DM2B3-1]|uniref:MoxR family ATPase n=1 Tax=Xanthocytophaga flava TaxID=3048013 RepID=A0ABT7CSN6_9BACT|nr:MoxR family ATPase [Xanthocytophaga flavus]MDJ1468099.1 MoxR family ATPase [Xanthocytophaga flavus]MDJ1495995.1 MoxR family ATPase [Xanthocytophaga flavus]
MLNTTTYVQELQQKLTLLKKEIGKAVIGQEDTVEQLLIALLASGHALLEGVPGLGKTLLIRSVAQALHLKFRRIQFTPDLMPSDIVGTSILQEDESGQRKFKFIPGPLFANIILADEINRTPPKTQAALLEAMQEKSVTYSGKTYKMQAPYFILATQNPLEQAGTFPLPEAQLDRFLLYIQMEYPESADELEVLRQTTGSKQAAIEPVLSQQEVLDLQHWAREVTVHDDLLSWINRLVRATRSGSDSPQEVKDWVQWGAGTRAGQALVVCAKARALIKGRYAVTPEDIEALAKPVLRHRILLNFKAEADGVSPDRVIEALLSKVRPAKGA